MNAAHMPDASPRDDEFLAMLAQEFRNPLAPIPSAVEIMRVIGQRDPALEKAREVISRQVDQLSRLVDQLLDLSRIRKGSVDFEVVPVDVNSVLWRGVDSVQPLIEERGHELKVLPLTEPANVAGNFDRLAQVISNLLDNAARFTERGGHIVLSATIEADQLVIRVIDDGIGIASESLANVFELFTQASRIAERPQGGLGVVFLLLKTLWKFMAAASKCIAQASNAGASSSCGSRFSNKYPRWHNRLGASPAVRRGGLS